MSIDFLVIKMLIYFETVKKVVNTTDIGALTGIILGTAIEVSTFLNSKPIIKNSVPRQTFNNLVYLLLRLFLIFLSSSKYLYWFIIR